MQVVRCKSKIKAIAFSSKKAKLETAQISVALNNNSVEVNTLSLRSKLSWTGGITHLDLHKWPGGCSACVIC